VAKLSSADLMNAFREMTLLELAEFVKDFEDTFGVTAQVSQYGTQPAVTEPVIAPEEDDQTEFDVVLEAAGDKKIQVIKEVRAFTKLGLAEAKQLVESAPVTVLAQTDKETADRAFEQLRAAGASVAVR
jgi:large subunit ribosomal protein L7/L12